MTNPTKVSGIVPRRLRILTVHATRGFQFVGGCVLLIAASFMAFVIDAAGFAPGWSDLANSVAVSTAFIAPLSMGLATVDVQAASKEALAQLLDTAPSGRVRTLGLCMTSTLAWGYSSLTVSLVVLAIRTPSLGAPSWPSLLLLCLPYAVVTSSIVVGMALGHWFNHRLLAPAISVSTFLWIYGMSYASGWYARLSPIDPATFYRIFLEPRPLVVALQLLVAIGLLAVGIAAFATTRIISLVAILVGATIVAVAATGLAQTDGSTTRIVQPPSEIPCSSTRPQVCVWPSHDDELAALSSQTVLVRGALDDLVPTPVRFAETGLYDHRDDGFGVLSLPDADASSGELLQALVYAWLAEPACALGKNADAARSWRAYGRLREWIYARLAAARLTAPIGVSGPMITRIQDSIPAQRNWVQKMLGMVAECKPKAPR